MTATDVCVDDEEREGSSVGYPSFRDPASELASGSLALDGRSWNEREPQLSPVEILLLWAPVWQLSALHELLSELLSKTWSAPRPAVQATGSGKGRVSQWSSGEKNWIEVLCVHTVVWVIQKRIGNVSPIHTIDRKLYSNDGAEHPHVKVFFFILS
jgi:hypothetical protein